MNQFDRDIIEQDIKRLSQEIAEKRKVVNYKEAPERELVKQALEPLIKQPTAQPQPVQPPTQSKQSIEQTILPDYLENSSDEIKLQVEKLLDAVFQQGISKTVKQAQSAGPFILDAFHDALTDKLYDELKSRKLI